MLGYLPGLIHSWYIISKYSWHEREYYYEDLERQGRRRGGERIVIITQEGGHLRATQQPQYQQQQQQQPQQQQPHPSYGSTSNAQTAVNDQPPPYEDSFKIPNNQ